MRFSLFVIMSLMGTSARAELDCQFINPSLQQCTAGLPSEMAGTIQATQAQSQWCWAASISMVLHHLGYQVSQARIVSDGWGGLVNMPASPQLMVQSLNRVWVDDLGRRFMVMGDVFSANPMTAAQDLSENKPLIIGTMGHAMVLTAVRYLRGSMGQGEVNSATVRDPWPGRGKRDLTAQEWFNTNFLVRIRVQPLDDAESPFSPRTVGADWAPTSEVEEAADCRDLCKKDHAECQRSADVDRKSCLSDAVDSDDRRSCREAFNGAKKTCSEDKTDCLKSCSE